MSIFKLFITHTPNSNNYAIKRNFVINVIAGSDFQTQNVPRGFVLDNSGENISALNKSYCELTTLYWAWKNVVADYYGFCHYRRLFSFRPQPLNRKTDWGVIPFDTLNEKALKELCWDEDRVKKAIDNYDFIIAKAIDTKELQSTSVKEHWYGADVLNDKDYDCFMSIIAKDYPMLAPIAEQYSEGSSFYPCNMFIAKKELLDDYCSILFSILEKFETQTDMSDYSVQAKRVTGHLAERFTGIYFEHLKTLATYDLKELEIVRFNNAKALRGLAKLFD